jgi:hypothetical protein
MKTGSEKLVRTKDIATEFKLLEPFARELVMEQTRFALLRSGLAWFVLLAGFAVAGWVYFNSPENGGTAVKILLGTGIAWFLVGRMLAGRAIRKAAQARSARIHGVHS